MQQPPPYATSPGTALNALAPGQIAVKLEAGQMVRTLEAGRPSASAAAAIQEDAAQPANRLFQDRAASDNGYANIAAVVLAALLSLVVLVLAFRALRNKLFRKSGA